MRESKSIDFAKLLGFETVCDRMTDGVDFQDETVGAKLGAKVGDEPGNAPAGTVDYAKLLGFDMVSNEVSGPVDFRDETIDAKLGAKVGTEFMVACDIASEFPDDRD